MSSFNRFGALEWSSLVVEWAKANGKSKRLDPDVYHEMDNARWLFALNGIEVPYRVTKTQEVYFAQIKKPLQELTIQKMNILRFHEDADELAQYVVNTKLPRELNAHTLDRVISLVESFPVVFDLNENNIPNRRSVVNNCPAKAFREHMLTRFVFVDSMEQFWLTPAPVRALGMADYGLRATTAEFQQLINKPNICFAFGAI